MKSERAKKYINGLMDHITVLHHQCKWHLRMVMIQAVELAEQEAEERMRTRATEAFKSSCKYQEGCLGASRKCDPRQCEDLRSFIQKLSDDEKE